MPVTAVVPPTIEVVWKGIDLAAARRELLAGLLEAPRSIPSKYFYDERGSRLFDTITELPEYYQTRSERLILEAEADRIAAIAGATQLVELGSGTSTKTRVLIDAMWRRRLQEYVPLDVDEATLRRAADEIAHEYPGLRVHGIVGDFMAHVEHLPAPPEGGPRLAIFLGGTIGNLHPELEAPRFLRDLCGELAPGDLFLLGVDLVKPAGLIEAAYNDAGGVTAKFNVNVLRVVNRLLDGDFDTAGFEHLAFYDRQNRWIEMRLVPRRTQTVRLGAAGRSIEIADGEQIRTEISAKYDRERLQTLLDRCDFEPVDWFTDPEERFGLSCSRRV